MTLDDASLIEKAAIAAYPNEACGLVVRVGKKSVLIECPNTHDNPAQWFRIDPKDYAKAAGVGEIVGVWHTHVDQSNNLSIVDRVEMEKSELPWYIASIHKIGDEFKVTPPAAYHPEGYQEPYIDRPYIYGVFDCWSLVRDYYKREYEIVLGEYPRIEEFWKKGYNFFGENFKREGFEKLIDQEPQVGDLFLIQTDNHDFPNHIAIYIGDDQILHHCHGRLSRRDIYGGYWSKHTMHHLRHKSKC